ncbi:hypothetical protein LMG3482_03477 [Achromobacter deleyi]|nr:hypothetical protein LMG3482_03477 [Achromobacter deleyi]
MAVGRWFAARARRPRAGAPLPQAIAAARFGVAGNGLAGTALEGLRGAVAGGFARTRGGRRASLPPILQTRLALAVKALAAARIGVGHIAAMVRIVLPVRTVAIGRIDALVDVDVVVPVDIDVDVVMAPIEAAPHRIHRRHAQPETDAGHQRRSEHGPWRWRVVGGGIGGVRPGAVDHGWVVTGHVDHLRIGRLDHHHGLAARIAGGDLLLRRALEVAGLAGLGPQPLHGIHDVVGLRQEGIAHRFHPGGLAAHQVHHRWKGDQRLDAGVPGFGFDGLGGGVARQIGVRGGPLRGRGDVVGVGGPHQHLR